jgi:glutaredoxin
MKYVVFSKSSCPFCQRAEEVLADSDLDYHVIDFEDSQEKILQEIKQAFEWPTVPMVFEVSKYAKINFIGGCSDLEAHLGV